MSEKNDTPPCCKPGWFDRIWSLNEVADAGASGSAPGSQTEPEAGAPDPAAGAPLDSA